MNIAIERKFRVVEAEAIRRAETLPRTIRQAYPGTGKTNMRVRTVDASAWLSMQVPGTVSHGWSMNAPSPSKTPPTSWSASR